MPCSGCILTATNVVASSAKVYSSLSQTLTNSMLAPNITYPKDIFRVDIYGDGAGALTGISGFYLGRLTINMQERYSGYCNSRTGLVLTTGYSGSTFDFADTGRIDYAYVSGCKQEVPCKFGKLWFEFSGNSNLYSGVPSARTNVTAFVYGASNGLFPLVDYGMLTSGNQSIPSGQLSMTNVRLDCGQSYSAVLSITTMIPGQTGTVTSFDYLTIDCSSCV